MAIRDWSTRKIRWMWAVGLLVECLLLFAVFLSPEVDWAAPATAPPDSAPLFLGSHANPSRQELYQYLHDSLGIAVTPSGDTLTSFTKDSFGLTVLTQGDSVRRLELSPAAERRVAAVAGPIVTAFSKAMDRIVVIILTVLAIILLPIPLTLITITLLWRRARLRLARARLAG
jgi:hypothetical protein